MKIKLTSLGLIVFSLVLMQFAAPTSVSSASLDYTEGVTPVFTTEPDPAGYGGVTGVFSDDFLDDSGNLHFEADFPAAANAMDYGKLYVYEEFEQDYFLRDSSPECTDQSGVMHCVYSWKADISTNGDESDTYSAEQKAYVEYTDENSQPARVAYLDGGEASDEITFSVMGALAKAAGFFDNQQATTVTDPTQKTFEVSVLARSEVTSVAFDLAGDVKSVTNYTTVSDSGFYNSQARLFTYEWDINSLSQGRKIVKAQAAIDGAKKNSIYTKDGGSYIEVTIAVSVNEKLAEQCEANKSAVEALIQSINKDVDADVVFLNDLYLNIRNFKDANEITNPEIEGLQNQNEALEIEWLNARQDLDAYTEISCAGSLSDDITAYKDAYNHYSEQLDTYRNWMVDYAEAILGEA